MFMCVVNLKSVNKLDLTWKQSFLILGWMTFRVNGGKLDHEISEQPILDTRAGKQLS
jgi:hypothetical protein